MNPADLRASANRLRCVVAEIASLGLDMTVAERDVVEATAMLDAMAAALEVGNVAPK